MYDVFDSVSQAQTAYRRARTTKHFILSGRTNNQPKCACCAYSIFDFAEKGEDGTLRHTPGYQSNRCEYNPRTKKIRAMHYLCAWEGTLKEVIKVGRAMA